MICVWIINLKCFSVRRENGVKWEIFSSTDALWYRAAKILWPKRVFKSEEIYYEWKWRGLAFARSVCPWHSTHEWIPQICGGNWAVVLLRKDHTRSWWSLSWWRIIISGISKTLYNQQNKRDVPFIGMVHSWEKMFKTRNVLIRKIENVSSFLPSIMMPKSKR